MHARRLAVGPIARTIACSMLVAAVCACVDAQTARPELSGVWVAGSTAPNDPRTVVEDILCGNFCSVEARAYMREQLADPRNDSKPLKEINDSISAFNRRHVGALLTSQAHASAEGFDELEDPVVRCVPSGFNFAAGPLPVEIEQHEDRVLLRYEFWNGARTVYTDGRGHPADLRPTRLGHSIGWYDGSTLVVETRGIEPHITYWSPGVKSSERAVVIERYTRSDDGERLEIEKTFVDPMMLRRPLTTVDSRLLDRDLKLLTFECEPPAESGGGSR